MAHWVLVRDVNAYDQYGSYYDASWSEKPTVEQLQKANSSIRKEHAEKLLSDGFAQEKPYPGEWEAWKLIKVKKEYYFGT